MLMEQLYQPEITQSDIKTIQWQWGSDTLIVYRFGSTLTAKGREVGWVFTKIEPTEGGITADSQILFGEEGVEKMRYWGIPDDLINELTGQE